MREVMAVHLSRLALRTPRFSGVFELSHSFLLLGVHRDDRLTSFEKFLHLLIDIDKLGVSLRRRQTFLVLPVGLEGIAQLDQSLTHRLVTHWMALPSQLLGNRGSGLIGPSQ